MMGRGLRFAGVALGQAEGTACSQALHAEVSIMTADADSKELLRSQEVGVHIHGDLVVKVGERSQVVVPLLLAGIL